MASRDDLSGEMACRITVSSSAVSVRSGLKTLFADPVLCTLPPEAQSQAEIVLAEVLNNVTEHAYALSEGETEVSVNRLPGMLCVSVTDSGLPFPDGRLPQGNLPDLGEDQHLPEGGFGWHLIRTLTSHLTYFRVGQKNHLQFRISLTDTPDW